MSDSCSHVITFWGVADVFALLLCDFVFVFVTLPYGVLGQVCYLTVSIPVLCVPPHSTYCQRDGLRNELVYVNFYKMRYCLRCCQIK